MDLLAKWGEYENLLRELPVLASETVERMTTWDIFLVLVDVLLGG